MKILSPSQLPTEIIETPLGDPSKLYKTFQDMREVCLASNGKGLSAVQVGIPWKSFVVADIPLRLRVDGDPFGYFVNCEYTKIDDQVVGSIEGCLSLLDESGQVRRFRLDRMYKIRVKGIRMVNYDLIEFDEVLDISNDAIVMQHEIDHHNQILISDLGQEIFLW
jgi:peptide deformylase